jgi:hypothetical protein
MFFFRRTSILSVLEHKLEGCRLSDVRKSTRLRGGFEGLSRHAEAFVDFARNEKKGHIARILPSIALGAVPGKAPSTEALTRLRKPLRLQTRAKH